MRKNKIFSAQYHWIFGLPEFKLYQLITNLWENDFALDFSQSNWAEIKRIFSQFFWLAEIYNKIKIPWNTTQQYEQICIFLEQSLSWSLWKWVSQYHTMTLTDIMYKTGLPQLKCFVFYCYDIILCHAFLKKNTRENIVFHEKITQKYLTR